MLIKNLFILFFILSLSKIGLGEGQKWTAEEETSEFWNEIGQDDIRDRISLQDEGFNRNVAKNIILFLGDGMGFPTVTTGRILKGQLQNKSGEETVLSFDAFPHTATSLTYSVDKQTSDSACTGTAYLTGVKTNYGVLGLNGKAMYGDCSTAAGNEVQSILMDAYDAGKSTGIVTTTRITHATPAASYSHCPTREWEGDSLLPQAAKDGGCKDIAQQFIDQSDKITVTLGGGRQYFMDSSQVDPEYPTQYGEREDGQNLVKTWLDKAVGSENRTFVWNQAEFDSIDVTKVDRLLGLFEATHMNYEVDRPNDTAGEPSLSEMTSKAIQILKKNSNGYALLVEGGRIDHGHHDTNAYTALHDVVAFEEAIEIAKDLTSDTDTLIVVTADHSHTMSHGGYADRGNPIFGLAPELAIFKEGVGDDMPYTTLLYGNGPGYEFDRENLTLVDTGDRNYTQQKSAPRWIETHGGEDVGIYASGPMAHLFHGVQEQSYIPHVFRYASCIGGVTEHCDPPTTTNVPTTIPRDVTEPTPEVNFIGYRLSSSDATVALYVNFVLVISLVFFALLLTTLAVLRHFRRGTAVKNIPTGIGNGATYHNYDIAL